MENKNIHDEVDAFLAERRKSSGGWAEITPKDIFDLKQLIYNIIKAKCESDPDGDYPINFTIVDRTRFEPMHFSPVEYNHQGEKPETLDSHLANLSIAMDRVNIAMRLRKFS